MQDKKKSGDDDDDEEDKQTMEEKLDEMRRVGPCLWTEVVHTYLCMCLDL